MNFTKNVYYSKDEEGEWSFKYRAHCVAVNALDLLLNQVLSTSPGRCVRRAEIESVINQNISNINMKRGNFTCGRRHSGTL